jgi:hypothetical protein
MVSSGLRFTRNRFFRRRKNLKDVNGDHRKNRDDCQIARFEHGPVEHGDQTGDILPKPFAAARTATTASTAMMATVIKLTILIEIMAPSKVGTGLALARSMPGIYAL